MTDPKFFIIKHEKSNSYDQVKKAQKNKSTRVAQLLGAIDTLHTRLSTGSVGNVSESQMPILQGQNLRTTHTKKARKTCLLN